MFREMSRPQNKLSHEECAEILKNELRGVLSVLGDGGYPYGVPMNHWYCEEDGKIYFHGGKQGHKIDALNTCDKASFCVCDRGSKDENGWALTFKSVIVFGRVRMIEEPERILDISRKLSLKFTNDEKYIESEIEAYAHRTLCFELNIEHISGKLVREA